MEPTVTSHDLAIWSISIKDLLWDPKGRKFFKEFLMTEFCVENILFYEAYLDLMELTSTRKEFIEQAKIIFEQFIYPKAAFELNMESKFRETIIKRFHKIVDNTKHGGKNLKPLDEELFEDVKRIVVGLMNKNSYQRFIQSLGSHEVLDSTNVQAHRSPSIFHRTSIRPTK